MVPGNLNRRSASADPGSFEGPGFARMPSAGPPGTASPPDSPPPNQFYASPALDPDMRKRCPLCAEQVNAAAHICRFCGYSFDDGTSAEGRAAAQARLNAIEAARRVSGRRSGFCLRVLLLLLFLLFVFALVGVILLNALAQIGHLTRTPVPTGLHPSPSAARTAVVVSPSAPLFKIEIRALANSIAAPASALHVHTAKSS